MTDRITSPSFRATCLAPIAAFVVLWPALAGATPGIAMTWTATTGTGTTGAPVIDAVVGDVLTLDVVVVPDADGMRLVSHSLSFDPTILTALGAVECPTPPNTFGPGVCNDSGFRIAVPFTTGVGNPSPTSGLGDFDANGAVGASDVALFMADFGLAVPPGNPAFDLDGDLLIGIPDLNLAFVGEFGFPGSPGILSGAVLIIETFAGNMPLLGSFTLARIELEVVGGGSTPVEVAFLPRVDGYVDGTHSVVADSLNPAGVTITNASVTVPGPGAHVPALGAAPALLLAAALLGAARTFRRGRVR